MSEDCSCGRGTYNPDTYTSCYDCFQDRRSENLDCIFCGKWHNPKFSTCFQCRRESPDRDEAGAHLRRLIHIRDGFTCRYCGDAEGPFQVDHIRPCAHGGKADQWNLQTLCASCNREKGRDFTDRDERQLHDSMEAYFSYLYEYLASDEQDRLRSEMKQWLGGSVVMKPHVEAYHLAALSGDRFAAMRFSEEQYVISGNHKFLAHRNGEPRNIDGWI